MKPTATAAGLAACLLMIVLASAGAPAPAVAQDIQVSSADPPSAPQGTVNLNVTIKGKGFKRGAVARFFRTGTTDPDGITVNSTSVASGSEVVANINIADTATIASFDIEVQNADGRTGKGTELFTVTEKGAAQSLNPLARADFRDLPDDRVRSDGGALPIACQPADYADFDDPCEPGHRGVSNIHANGQYFLRTLSSLVPNPTRWLVLDFSEPLSGSCPALDTALSAYPGRNPAAFSPVHPDPCIDLVEVRFYGTAFAPGAEYTSVSLLIDGPDSSTKQSTGTLWKEKYSLSFVNPLTITPPGAATVTLETMANLEQAELWTVNPRTGKRDTFVGTYRMPFQLTIARLP